jgi:hypothetical protein
MIKRHQRAVKGKGMRQLEESGANDQEGTYQVNSKYQGGNVK